MLLSYACPAGMAICDDVTATNGQLLLFPFALLVALLIAWPLTRFFPPRPLLGWSIAIIGAVIFVYLSDWWPLLGFLLGVTGIAVARGERIAEPHAANIGGPPTHSTKRSSG